MTNIYAPNKVGENNEFFEKLTHKIETIETEWAREYRTKTIIFGDFNAKIDMKLDKRKWGVDQTRTKDCYNVRRYWDLMTHLESSMEGRETILL